MALIGAELLWPLNLRIKWSSGITSLAKDYEYLDTKLGSFINFPDALLASKDILVPGIADPTIERAIGLARSRDDALPTRQGEYLQIFSIQHEREQAISAKQKKKQQEKLVVKDHLSHV